MSVASLPAGAMLCLPWSVRNPQTRGSSITSQCFLSLRWPLGDWLVPCPAYAHLWRRWGCWKRISKFPHTLQFLVSGVGDALPYLPFPEEMADPVGHYYPTPCPLLSCATSVVFQPKQHTRRLLFLSFGKTFLKRKKTQTDQTTLLDSVLSSSGCTISLLPLQKSLQGPSFPSFLVSALASPVTSSALSQVARSVLSTDCGSHAQSSPFPSLAANHRQIFHLYMCCSTSTLCWLSFCLRPLASAASLSYIIFLFPSFTEFQTFWVLKISNWSIKWGTFQGLCVCCFPSLACSPPHSWAGSPSLSPTTYLFKSHSSNVWLSLCCFSTAQPTSHYSAMQYCMSISAFLRPYSGDLNMAVFTPGSSLEELNSCPSL